MKHVLHLLTTAAEGAESDALTREACADSCARDGDIDRAENLRAQSALDREMANEFREALNLLQLVSLTKRMLDETPADQLETVRRSMLADLAAVLDADESDPT